jgi:hypothetical protein
MLARTVWAGDLCSVCCSWVFLVHVCCASRSCFKTRPHGRECCLSRVMEPSAVEFSAGTETNLELN